MTQYIDKDAVAAELERRKKKNLLNEGAFEEDIDMLSFLNTLDVGTIGKNIIYETVNKEWPIERNEKFIEMDFDNELKTESGVYVCVDANTKIYYKGDFPHCYLYSKMFHRQNGWELELLSLEKYNEMIETIKKI